MKPSMKTFSYNVSISASISASVLAILASAAAFAQGPEGTVYLILPNADVGRYTQFDEPASAPNSRPRPRA